MKKSIVGAVLGIMLLVGSVHAEQYQTIDGVMFDVNPRLPQVADQNENNPQPVNTGFSDMHYVVGRSTGIVGAVIIVGSALMGKTYCQPLAFLGGACFGTSAVLGFGL
jgi:hypothetical protein